MKNRALLHTTTVILNLIVVLIGLSVLIGWKLDNAILKSVFSGQVTMKINTAIGLIVCGCIVAILSRRPQSPLYRYGITFVSSIVLIIATLTLLEYIFQFNLDIHELNIINQTHILNTAKMSPTTAFCFFNIAISIILAAQSNTLHFRKPIVGALSITVTLISGAIFFSYIPNMIFSYHLLSSSSMGIHTSLAFILLSSSLFLLIYAEANYIWALNAFVTLGCFFGLVVIIFAIDAYHVFSAQIRKNDNIILQNQQILKEISFIAIDLAALENSEYNFIITRENKFFVKNEEYKHQIQAAIEKIDIIIPNNGRQQILINKLKNIIKKRINLNNINEQQDIVNALQPLNSTKKLQLVNEIYTTLLQLQHEIDSSFSSHIYKQNITMQQTFLMSPLSIFSVVTLLVVGLFMVNASQQGRKKINTMRRKLSEIVDSSNDWQAPCLLDT